MMNQKLKITLTFIGCWASLLVAQQKEGNLSQKEEETIADVQVMGQYIQSTRQTPIFTSTVDAEKIAQKVGTGQLPQALNGIPGVYVRQGNQGENGAQIYTRGFDQTSIALQLNGIPMSDMEYGRVFWGQWGTLARFAQSIQVQKGLGASKTIINSVGGSLNIITQAPKVRPHAAIEASYGSQNTIQTIVSGGSGLLKGDWMLEGGFAYQQTDGYNEGTPGRNYFYFASLAKKIKNHQLSLTFFAAPTKQSTRGGRKSWGSDQLYEDAFTTFNPYGSSGKYNYNQSFIPFVSLTDKWMINDKLSLQTGVYFTSRNAKEVYAEVDSKFVDSYYFHKNLAGAFLTKSDFKNLIDFNTGLVSKAYRSYNGIDALEKKDRGMQIDFEKIIKYNKGEENPFALYMQDNRDGRSMVYLKADHFDYKWGGGVSSLSWQIDKNFKLLGGVDLRYYTADHYSTVDNLLGGNYVMDLSPWSPTPVASDINKEPFDKYKEGDRISYAYRTDMYSAGFFAQGEYSSDQINAFLSLSTANTGFHSIHHTAFYKGDKRAENEWTNFWGFNSRAGISYNFTESQNIYANGGYFRKTPYVDIVFINNGIDINKDAKAEKIYSGELGYGLHLDNFDLNIGGYYTLWTDRARNIGYFDNTTFTEYRGFAYNAAQEHFGIELETQYIPTKYAEISGAFSWGNWTYVNNPSGNVYDVKNPHIPIPTVLEIKGLKVPNAPQIQGYFGITSNLYKGLYVGIDNHYFDMIYADFDPKNKRKIEGVVTDTKQSWRLPGYYIMDARIGWKDLRLAKNTFLALDFSVLNVTNTKYIAEARDGKDHDKKTSSFYYGNGPTWLATAKIQWKK